MFRMATLGSAALALLLLAAPAQAQNSADILQIEAVPDAVSNVLQHGANNRALIEQRALEAGALDPQNEAKISQKGSDNLAAIKQEGEDNSAAIIQNGSKNEGSIWQQYSGNNFTLQQSGNGMSAKIEQFGTGLPGAPPITITQSK